jgi:hypothetical protein
MHAEQIAARLIECDVCGLLKAWAAGDDLAGHIIRYLSSTPDERDAMLRAALAADERPDR